MAPRQYDVKCGKCGWTTVGSMSSSRYCGGCGLWLRDVAVPAADGRGKPKALANSPWHNASRLPPGAPPTQRAERRRRREKGPKADSEQQQPDKSSTDSGPQTEAKALQTFMQSVKALPEDLRKKLEPEAVAWEIAEKKRILEEKTPDERLRTGRARAQRFEQEIKAKNEMVATLAEEILDRQTRQKNAQTKIGELETKLAEQRAENRLMEARLGTSSGQDAAAVGLPALPDDLLQRARQVPQDKKEAVDALQKSINDALGQLKAIVEATEAQATPVAQPPAAAAGASGTNGANDDKWEDEDGMFDVNPEERDEWMERVAKICEAHREDPDKRKAAMAEAWSEMPSAKKHRR